MMSRGAKNSHSSVFKKLHPLSFYLQNKEEARCENQYSISNSSQIKYLCILMSNDCVEMEVIILVHLIVQQRRGQL